jgi:hypothetical protein
LERQVGDKHSSLFSSATKKVVEHFDQVRAPNPPNGGRSWISFKSFSPISEVSSSMGSKSSVEVLPSTDSPEEVQLSIKKRQIKSLLTG